MKTAAAIFLTFLLFLSSAAAAETELENLYQKTTFIFWNYSESSNDKPICYGFYWKPLVKNSQGDGLISLYLLGRGG